MAGNKRVKYRILNCVADAKIAATSGSQQLITAVKLFYADNKSERTAFPPSPPTPFFPAQRPFPNFGKASKKY